MVISIWKIHGKFLENGGIYGGGYERWLNAVLGVGLKKSFPSHTLPSKAQLNGFSLSANWKSSFPSKTMIKAQGGGNG